MILNVSEAPEPSNLAIQLLIILLLTAINAFLAAAELAILSADKNKLSVKVEEGNKKAKLVLKLQENETKLLSTIQVGITLAGFFSSATAAVSLSGGMAKTLNMWGVPFADDIALVVITLILSYFTLVLGELFPKRVALRSPEKIAIALAGPINFIKIIFRPVVFVLSASCNFLAKMFGVNSKKEEIITETEVMALVNEAVEDGSIKEEEQELIENVMIFGDLTTKDIMKPRMDVFMLDINSSVDDIKKALKEEQYTRVPVYDGDKDNVIGIINIKDIFFKLNDNFTIDEFKSILREPCFIVENINANVLFNKLNEKREHSAIVVDEYGSVSGYITMEDLIEEITGNIYDEYDERIKMIEKIDEKNFVVDASIAIQDLNKELDLNIPKGAEYNSLSGFIQKKLEHLSIENDEFYYEEENLKFKMLKVVKNRIIFVKITKEN